MSTHPGAVRYIPHRIIVLLLGILLTGSLSAQRLNIAPEVKRIVFLGNSITWAANYVNDIEGWITLHYPDRHFEFINVGVPSETVSGLSEEGHADGAFPRPDLHERLQRVLDQTKPDLVFASYGMNDGIYQPFDAKRFSRYKEGIGWLHEMVSRTGARLIHITPSVYDDHIGTSHGYDSVLEIYTRWLLSLRGSKKWEVVDVHTPMKKYLNAHRRIDANFNMDGFALSADGVHPNETGHWLMARQLLVYLGCTDAGHCPGIAQEMATFSNGAQIIKLVVQRQNMMRDAWLTATKHKRPGLPVGLPMQEAIKRSELLYRQVDSLLQTRPPSPPARPANAH